jgi:hypothetical protein
MRTAEAELKAAAADATVVAAAVQLADGKRTLASHATVSGSGVQMQCMVPPPLPSPRASFTRTHQSQPHERRIRLCKCNVRCFFSRAWSFSYDVPSFLSIAQMKGTNQWIGLRLIGLVDLLT